jgi:hypothetical protein
VQISHLLHSFSLLFGLLERVTPDQGAVDNEKLALGFIDSCRNDQLIIQGPD